MAKKVLAAKRLEKLTTEEFDRLKNLKLDKRDFLIAKIISNSREEKRSHILLYDTDCYGFIFPVTYIEEIPKIDRRERFNLHRLWRCIGSAPKCNSPNLLELSDLPYEKGQVFPEDLLQRIETAERAYEVKVYPKKCAGFPQYFIVKDRELLDEIKFYLAISDHIAPELKKGYGGGWYDFPFLDNEIFDCPNKKFKELQLKLDERKNMFAFREKPKERYLSLRNEE